MATRQCLESCRRSKALRKPKEEKRDEKKADVSGELGCRVVWVNAFAAFRLFVVGFGMNLLDGL